MKKKYKRAGTTSERQDYRKGGQVSKDGPRLKAFMGMSAAMGADFSKQLGQLYSGDPLNLGFTQTDIQKSLAKATTTPTVKKTEYH